ncbi:tRNA modification GTPase [Tanacetum coccineum]
MPHPDTDQDDHEIEDEFDEDIIEEEDKDEEDDDGGVILRLGEGMNGINVFDHVEVFGRDHSFPNDTLHVMPVEVFGSRSQGRTTSIYNLLGDQVTFPYNTLILNKDKWVGSSLPSINQPGPYVNSSSTIAAIVTSFGGQAIPTSHVVEYGVVCDPYGNVVDEVLAIPMLAPRSYTREDVVELQCHGSDVCLQRVLRACLEAGARLAEPG